MNINNALWKSLKTCLKLMAFISCFLFASSNVGLADARSDTQKRCSQKLGFAGIAIRDQFSSEEKWVCGCRGAFKWNQDRSKCIERQSNGANGGGNGNQPPENAGGGNNQQPQTPPVVRIEPKPNGQTPPSGQGPGRTRQDAQAMCSKQLGFAGIAVKDNSSGQTNWVCDCRAAFTWNANGTACVERKDDGDGQQPPNADYDRDQPPVVRKNKRKKVRRVAPPPRRKQYNEPRKRKKRVVRSKSATAHRYCRNRYGRRLVRVAVKSSKFYCHYKGKNAVGRNPRIKWKRIKFKNLR